MGTVIFPTIINQQIAAKDRQKLFWLFQFIFWFIHWIAWIILDSELRHHPVNLTIHTLETLLGLLITLVLRYFYKKYGWHHFPLPSLMILNLIYSVACSLIWDMMTRCIRYVVTGFTVFPTIHNMTELLGIIWSYSYPFVAWNSLYFGFKLWEELNLQKVWTERERALAQRAQLEMLRYQLNPHFLFNTLSSLRALIRVDAQRAEEMITQISEFLRYSLLEGQNSEVPLSKEIEIIQHYLDIEKVRYREKLLVEYSIDPLAEDYPIPVFLLHPLIENAIKHGMQSSPLPLRIKIAADVIDNAIHIDIVNSGAWNNMAQKSNKDGTGTGLSNTRKRLEHTYPHAHRIDVKEENGSVHVMITIRKESIQPDGKTNSRTPR